MDTATMTQVLVLDWFCHFDASISGATVWNFWTKTSIYLEAKLSAMKLANQAHP